MGRTMKADGLTGMTINVPHSMREALIAQAHKDGTSVSELIRQSINAYLHAVARMENKTATPIPTDQVA